MREVGIIGGGVSFHPRLPEIIRRFDEMGAHVHLPSLRLDEVPLEVIDMIKTTIKTLTFGLKRGLNVFEGVSASPCPTGISLTGSRR